MPQIRVRTTDNDTLVIQADFIKEHLNENGAQSISGSLISYYPQQVKQIIKPSGGLGLYKIVDDTHQTHSYDGDASYKRTWYGKKIKLRNYKTVDVPYKKEVLVALFAPGTWTRVYFEDNFVK